MKKKILAILVFVMFCIAMLAGCGNKSGSAMSVPNTPPTEQAEPAIEVIVDETAMGDASTTTEPQSTNDAAGPDETTISEPEEPPYPDLDVDTLLETHTIDFVDNEGYQIHETVRLSAIYKMENIEDLRALWYNMGMNPADIPGEPEAAELAMQGSLNTVGNNSARIVVGEICIDNLTPNFAITESNPRPVLISMTVMVGDQTYFDLDEHNCAIFYSDTGEITSKSSVGNADGINFPLATMTNDYWGPGHFIIVFPDKISPNQPDGDPNFEHLILCSQRAPIGNVDGFTMELHTFK